MNIEQIARIAHETNRVYCATLGDTSQPAWDDAPDWQRQSAIKGVEFHLSDSLIKEMTVMEAVLIPAKTIVHINGIPVALAVDTLVEMAYENMALVTGHHYAHLADPLADGSRLPEAQKE